MLSSKLEITVSLLQNPGDKISINVKTKEQYRHSRARKTKETGDSNTDHNVTDYGQKMYLPEGVRADWVGT